MNTLSTVRNIETITGEIRALQRTTLGCIIEIGRRLIEAKELLQHGEWGDWLEREVLFSQSTANNYMRLFEEYGSPQSSLFGAEAKSQTLEKLGYSKALQLLALPDEEDREAFVSEHDVENMSSRELAKALKDLAAEREAREAAERRLSELEAEEQVGALEEELAERDRVIDDLRQQIEGLKREPIEGTASLQPDSAALDAAAEKARAENDKLRKKEIAELDKKLKAAEKEKAALLSEKEKVDAEVEAIRRSAEDAQEKVRSAEGQLEALKKAQAMSDPTVTEFKTLFDEVQRMLGRLQELAAGAGENKAKLEAALAALLASYSPKQEEQA